MNLYLFADFCKKMRAYNALEESGRTFNEEYLKVVLDEMTDEYGVDVLFQTTLVSADCENGKIRSITVANVEGLTTMAADVFIDATGDGMLMLLSGAQYKVGREQDARCQPMTLCFRMGNVDMDAFYNEDFAKVNALWKEKLAKEAAINAHGEEGEE